MQPGTSSFPHASQLLATGANLLDPKLNASEQELKFIALCDTLQGEPTAPSAYSLQFAPCFDKHLRGTQICYALSYSSHYCLFFGIIINFMRFLPCSAGCSSWARNQLLIVHSSLFEYMLNQYF